MRRVPKVFVFAVLVMMVGLLPAKAEPMAAFHLEARVPASTLAFLSVEDVGGWAERLNQTSWGKMMADPEMQAFLAPVLETGEQLLESGMMEIPPVVMEMLKQLGGLKGQLAVALVDVDLQKEWFHAALSLDFGTNVRDFVTFLARLKTELDPQGRHVKQVEKNGRTWYEMAIPNASGSIYATTVDTAFVLATEASLLTSMLEGPMEGSLAQDEDYIATRRKLGGGDLGFAFYGNVDSALDKFGDMIPQEGLMIANALGLDTVKSIAYGLAFSGDGFCDTILIHAPNADHGLIPFMEMAPITAPKTLDLVPAGAFYWEEANIPFDDLMARVRTLVGSVDPDATQQMDQALEQVAQMLGVDIENELLAGMGGTFGAYAAFPQTGGLYPEVAVILDVKDPASFEGVFDRFAQGIAGLLNEQGDVLASTRNMDYHGTKVHLFELQAARGDDPVPFTPTWAIVGNRLVITLVPHAMKEIVLRANGEVSDPGLASKEDFRRLRALKPASAGGMEYLDLKSGMALIYDTLVPLLQTVAKPNVLEDLPFPMDWALLPPASRMIQYFQSMGSFVTWDKDGISISIQGPFPMLPLVAGAVGAAAFASFAMVAPGRMDTVMESEAIPMPGGDIEAEMDLELAKIQAEMLVEAVEFYRNEKNALPDTLEQLVQAGYMGSVPKDPWGGRYHMITDPKTDGGFAVKSAGPDKRLGTPDDVSIEKK